METIYTQLRQARESRGMSLADVASVTHINPDFLRAIEEGRTNILPQVYVRAFLREFATVVGLDPLKVIEEYESGKKPEPPSAVSAKAYEVEPAARPEPDPPADAPRSRKGGSGAIAAIVGVVVLGVILYSNFSRPPERSTQRAAERILEPAVKPERPAEKPSEAPIKPDSLRLTARTSDTVWVQVIIDARDSLDFIFSPNTTRRWKAGESFRVSVGRSGAVTFTLNDAELGHLGANLGIVRNHLIDRGTLSQIREGKQE